MGGVESMTAAAVAALLGGMWAQNLPQAQRNLIIEKQVSTSFGRMLFDCCCADTGNYNRVLKVAKAIFKVEISS